MMFVIHLSIIQPNIGKLELRSTEAKLAYYLNFNFTDAVGIKYTRKRQLKAQAI